MLTYIGSVIVYLFDSSLDAGFKWHNEVGLCSDLCVVMGRERSRHGRLYDSLKRVTHVHQHLPLISLPFGTGVSSFVRTV